MEVIQIQEMPSSVLNLIKEGETFALVDQGEIVAMVIPTLPAEELRLSGLAKGEFTVPDDFNEPVSKAE